MCYNFPYDKFVGYSFPYDKFMCYNFPYDKFMCYRSPLTFIKVYFSFVPIWIILVHDQNNDSCLMKILIRYILDYQFLDHDCDYAWTP